MATIDGTTGDDLLIGTSDNDVIDGGAGNDQLLGDLGSDVYMFGLGYGHDQIFNTEPEQSPSVDRILLNPDVSPADVDLRVVTQDAQGNAIPPSLLLTLRSSGETLLVYGNYEMSPSGYLNAAIDSIEFADGTVWNWMEIEQRSHQINGTSGDDVLVGGGGDEVIMAGAGDDVLIGGEGRDTLVGEGGSDTYVFGYGAGHDVVINNELESEQSVDRIHLAGVVPSDVALSVVTVDHRGMAIPASLLLTLRSTGETLLVREHFESQSGAPTTSAIDFIEFTDGTVWSRSDIQQLAGGGEPVSYITGTPWNDTLWGTSGNDVIDGGSGDDYMWGGEGSDTYVFGHGYGHDRISNTEPYENLAIDRIRLLPGVTPEDVELREVVQDVNGFMLPASLQLRLRSTGETLIVLGSVEFNMGNDVIDFIEFADGTVWDKAEIERRVHLFEGTAGDDWLIASDGDDVLDGGAGNDQLMGGLGSDTYAFGYGAGHDLILDQEFPSATSSDRILLKPGVTTADVELRITTADANGNSLLPSLQLRLKSTGETMIVMGQFLTDAYGELGITTIEFADGTVWDKTEIERRVHLFEGTPGDDWLMGTVGDDVLDGGAGNDVQVGDLGSDTYVFGQGSGHDMIQNHEPEGMTSSDRILLKPEVTATDVELRVVTMDANGWSIPPSLQLRLKSTGETVTVLGHFDPNVWGEAAITTIEFADGTVWDQAEIERRTHLFEGTPGDDWLLASEGDDVLDGGAGNDRLLGSQGSDTYLFGYGDGHDYIDNLEGPPGMTSSDRILLKPGVTVDDVELREVTAPINDWASEYSLQLRLKSTGETITVLAHFNPTVWGETAITTIEFADGTVWDQTEIERRAHLFEGTAGDDVIMATEGNDVLDGGAGNDQLIGNLGSDNYVFGQGSGHDVIQNHEPEGLTSSDRILLKPEVVAADVELRMVTLDANGWSIPPSLQLRLKSTGETMTVMGHFDPNVWGEAAITTIEFADGTVWDKAEIERRAHLFEGTTGDDFILGSDGDDVISGGSGNDQLQGLGGDDVLDGGEGSDMLIGDAGNDTYVFGQGSGHDYISNYKPIGDPSVDRILLKPGVLADDVELRLVTEDPAGWYMQPSLQLRLRSTGDTLVVFGHFDPNGGGNIGSVDLIEFSDGTVWDKAEIERRTHLFEGTAGDDVITATEGNDVLDGGAGNDVLLGSLGSDTYVFGEGYGHDVIHNQEPEGPTSTDRILLKPGITPLGVKLEVATQDQAGAPVPDSLLLRVLATGETLLVRDHFVLSPSGSQLSAIDSIEFADGTVWDRATIDWRARLIEGTAGDDVLTGTACNDVLDGGAGNDTMNGGLGDDTYVVNSSGDRVIEASGAGTDTVLSSVSHALASNVENLTLTGNAALNGGGNGLNNALFGNDGNNLLNGFGGHDTLYGGAGNDRLDGGSGNDTLVGGLGADVLLGGSGNDVYQFGRGDGADVVQDTGGNADVMSFLSGIEADQLWFRKTGSSLEISVIGTADKVTLSGWYSAYRIEEFQTADGKTLLDNDVHNLVQAMAAFAPPSAGQTTLPQSYAAALNPVIAVNWQ